MFRLNPRITGFAIALSFAMWGALWQFRHPVPAFFRWISAGIGFGFLFSYLLERWDVLICSRSDYYESRNRLTQKLTDMADSWQKNWKPDQPTPTHEQDWFSQAAETTIHFNENAFADNLSTVVENEPLIESPSSSVSKDALNATQKHQLADPKSELLNAIEAGEWAAGFKALEDAHFADIDLSGESDALHALCSSSMNSIFQRMHSGTVREDVAQLAQKVVDHFPQSKEGQTLAQVLGVLRRSAGLCPRCARPYKGVANACHDCLKGTAEAYQIAWDDDLTNGEKI